MSSALTENNSTLMKAVELIAIAPDDARKIIQNYKNQLSKKDKKVTSDQAIEIISKKIVNRYSKLAITIGVTTALPGALPGIGTVVAMVGGTTADISACLKFQIDMTMCLAVLINGELTNQDIYHMAYIIALAGTLEKLGANETTRIASKAGVKLLEKHLTGATLVAVKELFKKIGIVFSRNAVAKAIPFGVGAIVGGSFNYALTRYVGTQATKTLLIYKNDM